MHSLLNHETIGGLYQALYTNHEYCSKITLNEKWHLSKKTNSLNCYDPVTSRRNYSWKLSNCSHMLNTRS